MVCVFWQYWNFRAIFLTILWPWGILTVLGRVEFWFQYMKLCKYIKAWIEVSCNFSQHNRNFSFNWLTETNLHINTRFFLLVICAAIGPSMLDKIHLICTVQIKTESDCWTWDISRENKKIKTWRRGERSENWVGESKHHRYLCLNHLREADHTGKREWRRRARLGHEGEGYV